MNTTRDLAYLVAVVSRRLRSKFKESLPGGRITPSEWMALLWIDHSGGAMGQRQLAERLDLSGAPLTRLVQSLVTQGFVEQGMSNLDRRSRRLSLTAAARDPIQTAEKIAGRLRAKVFDEIPAEDLLTALRVMKTLASRLD